LKNVFIRRRTLKQLIIISLFLLFVLSACDVDEILNDAANTNISAKSKLNDVLTTARENFAVDAQLSALYGFNVSQTGEIDLSNPDGNAFIYVLQSDVNQSNKFYVPVFGAGPVESPIDFNDMLSLVKDTTASNILGNVFTGLSTVHIDPSVSYDDSPDIVEKMLMRSDVSNFRSSNSGSKIDMFLVPGKSIDSTSVTNSADWIVNFYADSTSLVLWLHPGIVTGTVTKISD
jgi:hypothetical protein